MDETIEAFEEVKKRNLGGPNTIIIYVLQYTTFDQCMTFTFRIVQGLMTKITICFWQLQLLSIETQMVQMTLCLVYMSVKDMYSPSFEIRI